MHKNLKYLVMPILTVVVWLIWVLLLPSIREHFLHTVSTKVERNILKNKKRRANSKKAAK